MGTIDNINHLNNSDFLSIFGNVFEKTESVAIEVFESKPFKNFEDIMFKMLNIYEGYKKNKILEILNAHPELAVAKKMTSESISEQASAKLNECSNEEYEEFKRLNSEYKKKFNFPFIIAVRGKNKNEILNNFTHKRQSDVESALLGPL
jgi:OHCU decarboxylase